MAPFPACAIPHVLSPTTAPSHAAKSTVAQPLSALLCPPSTLQVDLVAAVVLSLCYIM